MTPQFARVGCDIVSVADVLYAIEMFGSKYLERTYTPLERLQAADCGERLAVRFAAKEAVIKILRPDPQHVILYREIEIALLPTGAPRVRLSGVARAHAAAHDLSRFDVSLSHDGARAFATACAVQSRQESPVTVEIVRAALARYGALLVDIDALSDFDDLYAFGLSSPASINVMLACEDALDLQFDDSTLTRSTFATIASISLVLDSIAAVAR